MVVNIYGSDKRGVIFNIMKITLALISLTPFVSNAAAVTYVGSTTVETELAVFPPVFYSASNGLSRRFTPGDRYTAAAKLELDTDNLQLTYADYSLSADSMTGGWVDSYTVGFGDTVDITTTIEFDPVFSHINNVGPLNLTPTTGGVFQIERSNPLFSSMLVSGTITVSGPTESLEQPFSVSLDHQWNDQPLSDAYFPYALLETKEFPESIALIGFPVSTNYNAFFLSSELLFEGNVDGFDQKVDSLGVSLDWLIEVPNITLTEAVPIPSALWLFTSGLVGLVGVARRQKKEANSLEGF